MTELKIHEIDSGPFEGDWRIVYDEEHDWGPIVSKQQAQETYSRWKNSGLTAEEYINVLRNDRS